MSGYGPPPLARNAYHAERLYWQRNPKKRPPNGLTVAEAARVLGIQPGTLRARVKRGTVETITCKTEGLFFKADYIADLALAAQIKKAAK